MSRKNIKNEIVYFITYYKWIVLAFLIILSLGIYLGYHARNKKEVLVEAMFMDCHGDVDGEVIGEDYFKYVEAEKTQTADIRTNLMLSDSNSGNFAMTSLSSFLTEVGNEQLDVCGMLETDFLKYDASSTWMDLREVLPDDMLRKLEENLYETEDGRVIGIYAEGIKGLEKYGCYTSGDAPGIVGILYNTTRVERAIQFLDFLMDESYQR